MYLHASTSLYRISVGNVTIGQVTWLTGHKKGVPSQILEKSPLEFLTHKFDHALNLATGDMIRAKRLLRDTMYTTSELSKKFLNRTQYSPRWKKNYQWEILDLEIYALPSGQWEQRVSKVFVITGVLLIFYRIAVLRKN